MSENQRNMCYPPPVSALKAINGKRKREFSKLIRHINRNFALRRRLDSYHVMVDKEEAADILLRTAPPQGKKWSAFLKIDCGNKGPRTVHKRRSHRGHSKGGCVN